MPTIIENTQQMNALAEIESALSIIEAINTISAAQGGTLAIQYKPEKGRKVVVNLSDATRAKAVAILTTTKERMVKEVKTKAAKFRISLDEKDLACMDAVRKSEPAGNSDGQTEAQGETAASVSEPSDSDGEEENEAADDAGDTSQGSEDAEGQAAESDEFEDPELI